MTNQDKLICYINVFCGMIFLSIATYLTNALIERVGFYNSILSIVIYFIVFIFGFIGCSCLKRLVEKLLN